ncbi:MAG: rod shape-determining protein MreC [Bacteroidota bacterium]
MEQLLRIFYTNGSFFTFVGLQLVCLYLIVNFNSPQSEIFQETLAVRGGSISSAMDKINGFLDLDEQNQVLLRENAALLGQLPEAGYSTSVQTDSIQDEQYLQRFVYLATNVVNRSPFRPNNTLVIDRGENLGVAQGQGVVDKNGLIGIVDLTTERHARVISVLHQSIRISAGLRSGAFGTLKWDGQDPQRMTLADIPEYLKVSEQDTVFTTGFSNIFPTGQVIGTVESIEVQPGTGSKDLRVLLANDPLIAAHAYVVQDLFKEEFQSLQNR